MRHEFYAHQSTHIIIAGKVYLSFLTSVNVLTVHVWDTKAAPPLYTSFIAVRGGSRGGIALGLLRNEPRRMTRETMAEGICS